MSKKLSLGKQGENIAAEYLSQKAYQIVEMNWRCRFGELDIVAKDGDVWVFCEVKTQKGASTEQAFENLTPSKAEKLLKAIYHYIEEKDLGEDLWRVDAIGIGISSNGQPVIEHVEDAFDW